MVLRSDRMVVGFTSIGICSLLLINVCIKKMQIAILLLKKEKEKMLYRPTPFFSRYTVSIT